MARKFRRQNIFFYKNHESLKQYICFYCGGYGQTKDHIPPLSFEQEIDGIERIIVRSCSLCNTLLGRRPLFTLLRRCDYLAIKYSSRFEKILNLPEWSDEELSELKGSLKTKVINGISRKKQINSKINYLNATISALQGY